MVASFGTEALRYFRAACPEVATSLAFSEAALFLVLSQLSLGGLYAPPGPSLQIPSVFAEGLLQPAAERNIAITLWGEEDLQVMRHWIGKGVAGVITDRPDLLLQSLGRSSPHGAQTGATTGPTGDLAPDR